MGRIKNESLLWRSLDINVQQRQRHDDGDIESDKNKVTALCSDNIVVHFCTTATMTHNSGADDVDSMQTDWISTPTFCAGRTSIQLCSKIAALLERYRLLRLQL